MKIAIIGAGAIGSVAAAYLTKAGIDVLLVGREDQVKLINQSGLKVKGIRGEEIIPVRAAVCLDQEYDLVIFTTKSQDLEEAYQHNHQHLENGLIMTSQNGVQGDNILSCHFDKERCLSSIVMFGATYVNPGEVIFNFEGDWIIGNPYTPIGPKTHKVAEVLKKAFDVSVTNEIMGMKYLKLFINFNNCIPALTGLSMQETFADLEMCRLSIRLLKEGVDIVRKANIEMASLPTFPMERIIGLTQMPEDQAAQIIQQTLTTLSEEPVYGSILQSIKRGKTSEIDFINGEVVYLAREMKQEVPMNENIVEMVHQVERTGNYFDIEHIKKEFDLVGAEQTVPDRKESE